MTSGLEGVRGLVGKWRSVMPDPYDSYDCGASYAYEQCADELEAALTAAQQQGQAVAWPTEAKMAGDDEWQARTGRALHVMGQDQARVWNACLAACKAANAAPQPSMPEGWVLVPVEPTEAMQDAHRMYGDTSDWWNAMLAAAPALAQQPEARGVVDEARSERAWPVIGNLYLVKIGGVLQHEVFMFDQGDCEPGGAAPPFWSRDDLDNCPEFDPHKDQWIALDEIDAALTEARNVR